MTQQRWQRAGLSTRPSSPVSEPRCHRLLGVESLERRPLPQSDEGMTWGFALTRPKNRLWQPISLTRRVNPKPRCSLNENAHPIEKKIAILSKAILSKAILSKAILSKAILSKVGAVPDPGDSKRHTGQR